jgi:hypothetical protein
MVKREVEDEIVETLGSGRRPGTPFAVMGVVGTLIACVAGALILVGLLFISSEPTLARLEGGGIG